MTLPVFIATTVWCSLKAVDRKQRKVNPAITLSVKAKIVFNLDKTVFISKQEVNVSLDLEKFLKIIIRKGWIISEILYTSQLFLGKTL